MSVDWERVMACLLVDLLSVSSETIQSTSGSLMLRAFISLSSTSLYEGRPAAGEGNP